MHGHELQPRGFSPKTISNELGEEKMKPKQRQKKKEPKKEIASKENKTEG